MRNLVYAINVSADGCCDHTAFNPDDELLDYFIRLTRETGILLYGRKTYELMVPNWPDIAKNNSGDSKADNDFAQAFVSVPQIVVFSKTLAAVEDTKTTILRGNLQGEIQKLKQGSGKSILVGGVSLSGELIELGLVDEFHIVVHPGIVGKGRRLFDSVQLPEKLNLKMVESKSFKSGCVALRYLKR